MIQSLRDGPFADDEAASGYTDTQAFPVARTVWTYRSIYQVNDARVGV
jgi:hypothetical protein